MSERNSPELDALAEAFRQANAESPSTRTVNPVEKEAQAIRAGKLRDNPAMRTLLEFVRQDPDLYQQLRTFQTRREDFIQAAANPGELHRGFTATFAALELNPRSRALLNEAIERTVAAETMWHKEQILSAEDPVYYPEIVVGAGAHSAMYNAERMAWDPEHPALTIDTNDRIGGQFAQPENSAFRLNSRTRPDNPNLPNLPGTEGALNTIERGVLQQADLTGEIYGTQDTLADAIRVNHLLHSELMAASKLYKMRRNVDPEAAGKYLAYLQDTQTGQELLVATDRIINAGGLGREISGLDETDEATKQILTEEQAKFERGSDASLMTSAQLMQRIGNPAIEFPLQGYHRVAVVGPGDGGRIAVEALTGKMQAGKSVTNLDRVESISWLGQRSESCDEFKANNRLRYANEVALEFPRKDRPEYPSRIVPVDARAYRVEREGDGIRLFWRDANGQDVSEVFDHVVLATGYEDTSDEIFATLNDEDITGSENIRSRAREIATTPRSTYNAPRSFTARILSVDTSRDTNNPSITVEFVDQDLRGNPTGTTIETLRLNRVVDIFTSYAEGAQATIPGTVERQPVYVNGEPSEPRPLSTELQPISFKIYDTPQDITENAKEIVTAAGAILTVDNDQVITILADPNLPKSRIAYQTKSRNGNILAERTEENTNKFIRTYIRSGRVQQAELPIATEATEAREETTLNASEVYRRSNEIIRIPGTIINYNVSPNDPQAIRRLTINRYTPGRDPSEGIVDITLEQVSGATFRRSPDVSEFQYYYLDPEDEFIGVANAVLPATATTEPSVNRTPERQAASETLTGTEALNRADDIVTREGAIILYNDKTFNGRDVDNVVIDQYIEGGGEFGDEGAVQATLNYIGNSSSKQTFDVSVFQFYFLNAENGESIESVILPARTTEQAPEQLSVETLSAADAIARGKEIGSTPGAVITYNDQESFARRVTVEKYAGASVEANGLVTITIQPVNGSRLERTLGLDEFVANFLTTNDLRFIESVVLPRQSTEVQPQSGTSEIITSPDEIGSRAAEIVSTIGAVIELPSDRDAASLTITDVRTNANGEKVVYYDVNGTNGGVRYEIERVQTLARKISSAPRKRVLLPEGSELFGFEPTAPAQLEQGNAITGKEAVNRNADLIARTKGAEVTYRYASGDQRRLVITQITRDANGQPDQVVFDQFFNNRPEVSSSTFSFEAFKRIFLSTTITSEIDAVLPTATETAIQSEQTDRRIEGVTATAAAADEILTTIGAVINFETRDQFKIRVDQIATDKNNNPSDLAISFSSNAQPFAPAGVFSFELVKNNFLNSSDQTNRFVELPVVPKSDRVEENLASDPPIATKYENEDIYNIGPASHLPLTEAEVAQSDALQKINENTAALFRYGQYTAQLAERLAQADSQNQTLRSSRSEMQPPKPEPRRLQPLPREAQLGQTELYIIYNDDIVPIPSSQNSGDLLKYVTALQLREYIFPESIPNISITFKQNQRNGAATEYDVSFTPNILVSSEYTQAVEGLLEDKSVKNIIARASQTMPNRAVTITIPFQQGKVAIHGVSLQVG